MDLVAKGDDFEKKAEKKLNGWGIFSSSTKLLNPGKAGSTYVKMGQCHLKLDSKYEAASAYVDAAHCYKKTSATDQLSLNLKSLGNFACYNFRKTWAKIVSSLDVLQT